MPLSKVAQLVVSMPHSQNLLATVLNQPTQPLSVHVTNLSMIDIIEDLPTTKINVEQVVMRIEPSSAGCGVEAGGNHMLSMDSKDCVLEINVAMQDSNEEDKEELLLPNWEGVMVEDYDCLYRLLHA